MKVELTMLQKWLRFPFFSIAPFKMMDLYVKTMNISVQIHGQIQYFELAIQDLRTIIKSNLK